MREFSLSDRDHETESHAAAVPAGSLVALREAGIRRRFALALPRIMLDERNLIVLWAQHCRRTVETLRAEHITRKSWPSERALREILKMLEDSAGNLCDMMSAHHMRLSESTLRNLLLFNGLLESLGRLEPHLVRLAPADINAVLRAYVEEPLDAMTANGEIHMAIPPSSHAIATIVALSRSGKES